MKTVVVGMSGGVDSSVSALLLKQQGYRVVGLFMKNWDENLHLQKQSQEGKSASVCPGALDYEDVAATCAKIGIPFFSVDFTKEYQDLVFADFLEDYRLGFTPNPDILCNKNIKFDVFFKKALSLGADYLATGHYCQIDSDGFLAKGLDPEKDQSYFLNGISQDVLPQVLFPIGHLYKSQVRAIAKEFDLPTKNKKDSTGICFIGERNFREFLSTYIPYKPGPFCLLSGEEVGTHRGAAFYTIGQRRKLGLGGEGDPWFVIKKDIEKNIVYVERDGSHPELFCRELLAGHINWFIKQPQESLKAKCKVRYRQKDQGCTLDTVKSLSGQEHIRVVFDIPQKSVAKGQWIALYEGDRVIAGARILETF